MLHIGILQRLVGENSRYIIGKVSSSKNLPEFAEGCFVLPRNDYLRLPVCYHGEIQIGFLRQFEDAWFSKCDQESKLNGLLEIKLIEWLQILEQFVTDCGWPVAGVTRSASHGGAEVDN